MIKNKNCFYEITNNEIYEEIQDLKRCMNKFEGKIKLNTWLGSTALTFCLSMLIAIKFI